MTNASFPIGDFPTTGGYQCSACNQWVMSGIVHICPAQFNPSLPLPSLPIPNPPCNAHLFALTADAVRLIVREELERALGKRSAETQSGEPK